MTDDAPPDDNATTDASSMPSADAFRQRADDAARRALLAGRDHPCPGCGYNVRDLTGDRCPECHQELRVELRLADGGWRAYLFAVAGLIAATASGGLLFVMLIIGTLLFGSGPPGGVYVLFFCPTILGGAGLRWLARPAGRRTFQLTTPERRRIIIFISWLPFTALFIGFLTMFAIDL